MIPKQAELRVTVVLPIKDGAAHLPALLPSLRAQTIDGGLEILAIDSGSRDGSVALLEQHDVRTLQIPAARFDHGETRNLGAREARGRVVVFLTQDALPADASALERLAAAVEREPRVVGAFARQKPRLDADPLTRRDLAAWVAAGATPRTVFVSDLDAFERMPPLERYALAVFDNVASAVRRDVLLAHPFASIPFGEDLEWGLRMLRHGHGLAYVPDAVVVHSHQRAARALYRRNYHGHRLLYRLFRLHTIPSLAHLLRATGATIAADLALLARGGAGPAALVAAPLQAVGAVYGQYRGARDEALGRPYPAWSRPAR